MRWWTGSRRTRTARALGKQTTGGNVAGKTFPTASLGACARSCQTKASWPAMHWRTALHAWSEGTLIKPAWDREWRLYWRWHRRNF